MTDQPDRVLRAAAPSIGVESMICSAAPSSIPSSSASRNLFSSANPSFSCNNNRAQNFVNDLGRQPR